MNTDGSNPQQITFDANIDSVPAWSPDGTEIAFQSMRDGDFEVYIYTLATGVTRQVTFNSCADYGPAFSPDGSRIIYYSNCNSGEDQREIFIINTNGSGGQQLTDFEDHNNRYPTFSPDGSWITFTGYDNDGYYVYVMRADGTDIRRITRGCISSYSPDGTLILFTSYCSGGEVDVMNVDGTNLRQLTNTPNHENGTPAWSPDGTRILFQSDRDGDAEIFVINLDGSGETQLTFNSTHDGAAVWQP
jgi:TolB protein